MTNPNPLPPFLAPIQPSAFPKARTEDDAKRSDDLRQAVAATFNTPGKNVRPVEAAMNNLASCLEILSNKIVPALSEKLQSVAAPAPADVPDVPDQHFGDSEMARFLATMATRVSNVTDTLRSLCDRVEL